jgi:hypothetical protein
MAVIPQGKAQAGIERPSNRTPRAHHRGATRGGSDEVWGRRLTAQRGGGPSRSRKAGSGPCRAWSASHSDVHPPETVERGRRRTIRATSGEAHHSGLFAGLRQAGASVGPPGRHLFGGAWLAEQRHEGNGCREAVRLSTRGSLRRVQAPTQVGVARRERASTASRSSSGNR